MLTVSNSVGWEKRLKRAKQVLGLVGKDDDGDKQARQHEWEFLNYKNVNTHHRFQE